MPKSPLTFIDLFSGIGGFRIGMEHAGFKHVFSNDYDKYASQTYRAWYGSNNHVSKSLLDENILDEIPAHDILCGGFPCQPFSNAGKRLGFKDNKQEIYSFALQK
jgi:DNA (cytosine-5)-methyltransferase 1